MEQTSSDAVGTSVDTSCRLVRPCIIAVVRRGPQVSFARSIKGTDDRQVQRVVRRDEVLVERNQ